MGSRFRPGDRVRVAKPQYGTFGQTGTVTEPDEFWTFGPCVLLDGQQHAGAYLDEDLEPAADAVPELHEAEPWPAEPEPAWPAEPAEAEPAYTDAAWSEPSPPASREPVREAPPAAPVESDEGRAQRDWELYQRGLRDGWGEAVRHTAYRARVEGGALADAGTIAPELNGLIAGILARIESAEARALMAEANLTRRDERPPVPARIEPERASVPAQTLTTLIQAVSEIVIQERERARLHWQAKLDMAESRAEAERARRLGTETEIAELRRRAEPPQLPSILQEGALLEVLSCAEEFIAGGRLNRALVLHALRETLSHLRQANAYDALRTAAQPRKVVALERR